MPSLTCAHIAHANNKHINSTFALIVVKKRCKGTAIFLNFTYDFLKKSKITINGDAQLVNSAVKVQRENKMLHGEFGTQA